MSQSAFKFYNDLLEHVSLNFLGCQMSRSKCSTNYEYLLNGYSDLNCKDFWHFMIAEDYVPAVQAGYADGLQNL